MICRGSEESTLKNLGFESTPLAGIPGSPPSGGRGTPYLPRDPSQVTLGSGGSTSLLTQPRVSSRSSAVDGSFIVEPGGSLRSSGLGPRAA